MRSQRLSIKETYPLTEVSGERSSWETVDTMAMPDLSFTGRAHTRADPSAAMATVATVATSSPDGERNVTSTSPEVSSSPSHHRGRSRALRGSKASTKGRPT